MLLFLSFFVRIAELRVLNCQTILIMESPLLPTPVWLKLVSLPPKKLAKPEPLILGKMSRRDVLPSSQLSSPCNLTWTPRILSLSSKTVQRNLTQPWTVSLEFVCKLRLSFVKPMLSVFSRNKTKNAVKKRSCMYVLDPIYMVFDAIVNFKKEQTEIDV